jgi:O-antigen/teichoic acid export membrane protein
MLLKRAFTLSAGYVFNAVASGIFGIYVTRILGPQDKGVLYVALSSCGLMTMLFGFGVPYAAAYYIRAYPGSHSFILSRTNRVMLACAVLSLVTAVLFRDAFSSFFLGDRKIDALMAALLVSMVIVDTGNSIVGATLVAQGDSRGYAMCINTGTMVNIACTTVLLLLSRHKLHVVMVGVLLGTITATFMMRSRYRNHSGENVTMSDAVTVKNFHSYGVRAQSGALGSLVLKRLDVFLISYFMNTSAVGFYSVGVSLRDLAITVSRAFAELAGGDMADRENRENGTANRILKQGILFNVVVSVVVFGMALVLFPYFIPIAYGERFLGSVRISIVIMGSLLPMSISLLIGKAIQSKGMPLLQSINNVLGAIVGTVVMWHLTRRFGIHGAAAATVLGTTGALLLSFVFLHVSGKYGMSTGSRIHE